MSADYNNSEKEFSFEDGCKRLEEIVASLSAGDITLEKNIQLYAEGSKIIKACSNMLEQAKGVVKFVDEN